MEEGLLMSDNGAVKGKKLDASGRLMICRSCPLFIEDVEVCDPNLWLNPLTGEVSRKAKAGYTKGCGCLLTRKVRQTGSHCHVGKW